MMLSNFGPPVWKEPARVRVHLSERCEAMEANDQPVKAVLSARRERRHAFTRDPRLSR
jgi:hypothetical protein